MSEVRYPKDVWQETPIDHERAERFARYYAEGLGVVAKGGASGMRFVGSESGDGALWWCENYFFCDGFLFGVFMRGGAPRYFSLVSRGQHAIGYPFADSLLHAADPGDVILDAIVRVYEKAGPE